MANQDQFEHDVMQELWEIEEGKVMPGEFPTFMFHDDLGRFYINQNQEPANEKSKGVQVRLSLRQCMLIGEYWAAHIDQLNNLQTQ